MHYFTKILRYERRAQSLVPVLATSVLQPDGRMKCIRVTELQFPVGPDAWDANSEDWIDTQEWDGSVRLGYVAALQYTTRKALFFAGDIATDVSMDVQPVLQEASQAPVYAAYLPLDAKAREVHARDVANSFAGCDNPWVASLFPETASEEEEESEGVA